MKFQFIDYNESRNVFTAQLSGYKPEDVARLESSWLPGLKALTLKLASPDAENLERIDRCFGEVCTQVGNGSGEPWGDDSESLGSLSDEFDRQLDAILSELPLFA